MAPNAETEDIITMTSDFSKVHSLKAANFHTMAFKLSLEINRNKVTPKSLIAFLKVLYNVTQIKKNKITFEQYSRIHLEGPKIAICETKRCQMSFSFLIHPSLQKVTFSHSSTRSNRRFQQYAPRFWLYTKIGNI